MKLHKSIKIDLLDRFQLYNSPPQTGVREVIKGIGCFIINYTVNFVD